MSRPFAPADQARFDVLKARCEAAHVEVEIADDDNGEPLVEVVKWAQLRTFRDLDSFARWVLQLDGRQE
jgi:hypothetical protein